jgi:diacylglycerol kinase family enzyme
LIHNPTAGDGRPSAADLTTILEKAGFSVRYRSTKKDWKRALHDKSDLVVIAGGDGTVAKVLRELRGSGMPAGLIPIGTANNVARTLGISGDAREIVAGWQLGDDRPYDVGLADSGKRQMSFVESAGGGLLAQLMLDADEHVEKAGSLVGSELDRALHHLRRQVQEAPAAAWKVQVDGIDRSGHYIAVEAMNIRHAGPSVPIAPDAEVGDGILDVVLIRDEERDALMDYIDQRLAQHEIKPPAFMTYRGKRIELAVDRMPMRVDDRVVAEDGGTWRITVDPGAVTFLGAAGSGRI